MDRKLFLVYFVVAVFSTLSNFKVDTQSNNSMFTTVATKNNLESAYFVYSEFFPFQKIFNTSNPDIHYGCKPMVKLRFFNGEYYSPCCDCQQDCKKYGTCCIDLDWQHKPTVMKDYYKTFKIAEKVTCQSVLKAVNHEVESIYMMKKRCNDEASESLVQKCFGTLVSRSIDESVPVLGIDSYVYPNKYCALCNNVTEFNYVNYSVSCVEADLTLKNVRSIEMLEKQTDCIINIQRTTQNEIHFKKCIPMNDTEIKTSKRCSAVDKQLCFLYQGITQDGKYKNPHCRKCIEGNMPIDQLQCPRRCDDGDLICRLPDQRDLSKYSTKFFLFFNKNDFIFEVHQMKQKFPIWTFFNLSNIFHQFGKDEGLEQYLCSGRRETKCCSCEKNCMTNGRRCCIDVFWDENNPVDMETYQERFLKEADKVKDIYCAPILPNAESLGYDSSYAKMVKSCHRHASLNNIEKCLRSSSSPSFSPNNNIPVVGGDGLVYPNSYCAECNFIRDYRIANLSVKCQSKDYPMEERYSNYHTTTERPKIVNLTEMKDCTISIKG